MFEPEYYLLDELKGILGMSIGMIIKSAIEGRIHLKIVIPRGAKHNAQPFDQFMQYIETGIEPINTTMPHSTPFDIFLMKQDGNKWVDLDVCIKPFLVIASWGYKSNGDAMQWIIEFDGKDKIDQAIGNMVIDLKELNRLKALKAEHYGKPTAEQLQKQLDEANKRIAELESTQAQQDKDETGKGFNTSLAIIHALYEMAGEPEIKVISSNTEKVGRFVGDDAISNRIKNLTFKQ